MSYMNVNNDPVKTLDKALDQPSASLWNLLSRTFSQKSNPVQAYLALISYIYSNQAS